MSIRCRLGHHRDGRDDRQRYINMGAFGVVKTPSERCLRCGSHRIWLYGLGWSGVRYGHKDNLLEAA